jgi:hypothetical protein
MDRCPTCHRKHKRSNPANSKYWALLHECAAKLLEGKFSAEQMHVYYKSRFLGCDDVDLPNGKTLSIPRSTAGMDADKFSAYLDAVEADAAQRGVFLADLETM